MAKVAFKQAEVQRAAAALRNAGFERVELDLRTGRVIALAVARAAASPDDPERYDEEWAALDRDDG